MIPTFLKCAVVAMIVSVAQAQNEGRSVNARLVYFLQSPGDPTELYFSSNGEAMKCSPSGNINGTPVTCPVDASGKVVFTRAAGGQVAATANVPASVKEAVFFFLKVPGPDKGAPYQILVVDEALKTLPKGGSFICNLSPKNARVSLAESKYLLAPGKPVFVDRPDKKDDYNMAPLQMQIQGEGEVWKPLKDTMLRFSESERYFIVTYLEDGRHPAVKIYKQVVSETSPAPAP